MDSVESLDWRGTLGSHPSGAEPTYTTPSSSRRGMGGDSTMVDDVLKSLVFVDGQVPSEKEAKDVDAWLDRKRFESAADTKGEL